MYWSLSVMSKTHRFPLQPLRRFQPILFCLNLLLLWLCAGNPVWASPTITIILDDLGHNLEDGSRALSLPGAVTYALIPYRPHTVALAHQAHRAGKEVMVHMPMSSVKNVGLDHGGIHLKHSRHEVTQSIVKAIKAVPYARGMNNHMGSQFTQNARPLSWVMKVLRRKNMYFVDSRTSPNSIAWHVAEKNGVPNLSRDFFLDNERTAKAIHRQFRKAIRYAETYGHALIIGHAYPETLDYLEAKLPLLAFQGIQLLSVSEMFERQHRISKEAKLLGFKHF